VEVGHTTACISFEHYAGRPAALWSESVKTPERLSIGSRFTWQGAFLTVTSMRRDHLVACTYKPGSEYHSDLRVGDIDRIGDEAELAAARKQADAVRRLALKEIASTENPRALSEVEQTLACTPRGTYRHFDIEDFRKAIAKRREAFNQAEVAQIAAQSEAKRMERWVAGENVGGWFKSVRLRISGDYIETSTGHSVSVDSAKKALPFVLRHRHSSVSRTGLDVDVHRINRISGDGVLIGCTLIPWGEVDRIAPALLHTGGILGE